MDKYTILLSSVATFLGVLIIGTVFLWYLIYVKGKEEKKVPRSHSFCYMDRHLLEKLGDGFSYESVTSSKKHSVVFN